MTDQPTPPPPDDDPLTQVNVRIRKSLRDAVDERRKLVGENGISRDKWVARALTWALKQSATHGATPTAPGRRTAPPPHRR